MIDLWIFDWWFKWIGWESGDLSQFLDGFGGKLTILLGGDCWLGRKESTVTSAIKEWIIKHVPFNQIPFNIQKNSKHLRNFFRKFWNICSTRTDLIPFFQLKQQTVMWKIYDDLSYYILLDDVKRSKLITRELQVHMLSRISLHSSG